MQNLKSYITGYVLSITLTLLAFGLMSMHLQTLHSFPTHAELAIGFVALALGQLLVQLFYFLHLGRGRDKEWNMVVLGFALFIVFVLVGGTLWIMQNLQTMSEHSSPFLDNHITVQNEND